jgi:hypothetical protein
MRKLLLLVMIASAALFLAISVPARAASVGPSVTGIGTLGQFGDPTVRVSAIEMLGTAHGSLVLTYPDGTVVLATDTCLSVSGRTAYVTGQILAAYGPRAEPDNWSAGNYVIVAVVDNAGAGADLLNFSPGYAANPGCGPNSTVPIFPIVKGHFRVEDR